VYNAGGERVVKQYLPYATNQCAECPPGTGIDDLEVYERNSATPETYKARKTITFLSEYTDERYRDYSAIIEAGLAQCTPQCAARPPLASSDADFYIRDATGNVLAVYHYDRKTSQLRWSEQHLYGSARLGMYLPEKSVTSVSTDSKQREVGYLGKQVFELSNHLGNVLATITDKKLQVSLNTTSTAYFEADVQTVQDYYAFGMQMPGRKLSGGYRYGFNGHEREIEINAEGNFFSYDDNGYDARLGRRFNRDIFADKFPFQSPYVHANNSPIVGADISGDSTIIVIHGEGVAVRGSNGRTNVMYFVEVYHNLTSRNYNLHRSNGTLPKPNYTTELARDAHDIKAKGKIVFHSEKRYGKNNETPPGTYYLFKRGTEGDSESGRYELYIGDKSGSRLIKGPDGNRSGIAIHQYDPNDSQGCLTSCSGANTKPITDLINAIPDLNDDKQPVELILQPREIIKTQYQDKSNGKVKYQGIEHVYYGGFLPEVTVKTTKKKNQ
jgi:hypothetical protein